MEQNSEDALAFFNRLFAQLHQADRTQHGSTNIKLVYVASGAQNIAHLDTQTIIYQDGQQKLPQSAKQASNVPSPEAMVKAIEKTHADGLWYASTSWAVVYRIYQMLGYADGFSQFVREVATWPFTRPIPFECNFDAVQKPVTSGKLNGLPDTWKANGAHEQTAKLGMALMKELEV